MYGRSLLIAKALEHPFGTLKFWMGSAHFLMKKLHNVKTEMSLHVLAYNMKRAMKILGVPGLLQVMQAWRTDKGEELYSQRYRFLPLRGLL